MTLKEGFIHVCGAAVWLAAVVGFGLLVVNAILNVISGSY